MVSIKTPLVLAGIGIALVIIFFAISRFGIPVLNTLGKSASDAFSNASTGISDFFNSFDDSARNDIGGQRSIKDEFPRDFEKSDVDTGVPDDAFEGASKIFQNEKGQVFVDGVLVNPDNPNPPKEEKNFLDDITNTITDAFGNLFNPVPDAFADSPEDGLKAGDAVPKSEVDKKPAQVKANQRVTTVKGTAKNELGNNQEFQVFGNTQNNQVVRAVIRETPQRVTALKTDSKKNPTETASQRANRVFVETGKFVDEDRGLGVTKASEKVANFDFGTNTGSAIASTKLSARERIAIRKKLEEQKALEVFARAN